MTSLVVSLQVNHARDVWAVGKAEPESYDAMVTDQTGLVLAAPGADCMPILFADPVSKVIAVAHAGTGFSSEFVRSPVMVGGKDINIRFR